MSVESTHTFPLPRVPGHRTIRRLGQGGMAVVYLAVQESLDREVAIKVMTPPDGSDDAQARRFEDEARIIAKLEHPGIVGIHEVGRTEDGQPYYVMPYLSHGDLSRRDWRTNEAAIIDLLRSLLDALGYAHARGIVHRDVKAENVLFNNADRPQLTDFGIALTRRVGRARITTDGLAVGSGGYMSPEQARGEQVDGRADLYSVGVLAYELLTGELPFHAEDGLALALMHAQDPLPALPPDKAHWQAFLQRATAKNPDKRFRNAQAMARALDAVARRVESPRRLASFATHAFWRRPAGQLVLGMLAALVMTAVAMPRLREWQATRAEAAANQAPLVIPAEAVAPTDAEKQAARELRLQQAAEALASGALVAPAGANAAEIYLAVLRETPGHEPALAGLDTVLAALAQEAAQAASRGERETVRERYEQLRLLAESARLQPRTAWPAAQDAVRAAIAQRTEASLAAHSRDDALSWSTLPAELGLETPALAALRERAGHLPQAGATLQDGDGPLLAVLPLQTGASRLPGGLAMMRREITRAQYATFAQQTRRAPTRCRNRLSPLQVFARRQWNDPGFEQTATHPVACISFADAQAYATWLSARTGHRYRLPTLAEWRHAAQPAPAGNVCRAGNIACVDDGARYTAPGGSFPANRGGLQDLAGNVSEWTQDCDGDGCKRRVAAGTSWRDDTGPMPATHRQALDPERGYDDVGFRLVREF